MSESSSTHRTDGPGGVGLIGAGMISDTYLDNLTSFPDVRVLVVGDLDGKDVDPGLAGDLERLLPGRPDRSGKGDQADEKDNQ